MATSDCITTDHSDPSKRVATFDDDAQVTVGLAIGAFYRIRRLAIRAVDELTTESGDAESFCMAITEISQLHGKALDDCMTRVTGHPGVGCFDKIDN
jgi:hypothetical protein